MKVLVTGVSGYVGSRLAPRLVQAGHEVRGFGRRQPQTSSAIPVLTGDAVSGAGLDRALDGVEVAYFLIHSMEPSRDGAFGARERVAAESFTRAAQAAGVRRIIYLGGPVPRSGAISEHLASRLEVESILLGATPCSVAFRASIVIGASNRSFRFMVRLVERLPVLALPAWRVHRSSPIDERDALELLVRAATSELVCGQSLDAAGSEVISYGELIERIAHHMFVDRPTINFKRLTVTPVASRVASVIAGEQHELIGPLMGSLDQDLLPRDGRAAELLGVKLHSLDAAIEHALREWESTELLAAR